MMTNRKARGGEAVTTEEVIAELERQKIDPRNLTTMQVQDIWFRLKEATGWKPRFNYNGGSVRGSSLAWCERVGDIYTARFNARVRLKSREQNVQACAYKLRLATESGDTNAIREWQAKHDKAVSDLADARTALSVAMRLRHQDIDW